MFGLSIEEICIRKIEGAIRGIKFGTKKPSETEVGKYLNKLSQLNEAMYLELFEKYKDIKSEYDLKMDYA